MNDEFVVNSVWELHTVGICLILYVCVGVCRREHKSCEFEMHEAYAIDIIVSSGEGKVS